MLLIREKTNNWNRKRVIDDKRNMEHKKGCVRSTNENSTKFLI